jgi:lysophospholipase L1-like esterase
VRRLAAALASLAVLTTVPAGAVTARPHLPSAPPRAEACGVPDWRSAKRATVLVDSVLLGAVRSVRGNLAGWRVGVAGRPAIMIRILADELAASGARVAPLVVVGVGYNSLWQRARAGYARWAAEFDRQAIRLLQTLRSRGAEQFVWVTLRTAARSRIPSSARWQHDRYAWYFPYVNERLRRLDRRRSDVVLADWAAVSNRSDITYDAFHVNPAGAKLMARTIRKAIEGEAAHQAERPCRQR